MSDLSILSQSLVKLCRNPAINDKAAEAKVFMILDGIRKAAVQDLKEPITRMGNAGQQVVLQFEDTIWACIVRDPKWHRGFSSFSGEAEHCVQKTYDRWKQSVGLAQVGA